MPLLYDAGTLPYTGKMDFLLYGTTAPLEGLKLLLLLLFVGGRKDRATHIIDNAAQRSVTQRSSKS